MKLEDIIGEKMHLNMVSAIGNQGLVININTNTYEASLCLEGVKIDYSNKERFENPSDEFLNSVITAHKQYKEKFQKGREHIFREAADEFRTKSDIEYFGQFIPKKLMRATAKLITLLDNIRELAKGGKTLKTTIRENIKDKQIDVASYQLSKEIVKYGKTIMQESLETNPKFSDDIKSKYQRLINLCVDIIAMYDDTINRTNKLIQEVNSNYEQLYGKPAVSIKDIQKQKSI